MVSKSELKNHWYRLLSMLRSEMDVVTAHGPLTFHIGSRDEVFRVKTFHEKEPETLAWIDSFDTKRLFFDVGANIGIYSLYAALRGIRTYAYEPDGITFASLLRNIAKAHGIVPMAFPFALSNRVTLGTMVLSSLSAGAGAAALGERYRFTACAPVISQGVYVTSIDDLVFRAGFGFPSYIKIDVDGQEALVIEGAARVITDPRFKSLLVELQYKTDEDVFALESKMLDLGLTLSHQSEWVGSFAGLFSRNFIFIRKGV